MISPLALPHSNNSSTFRMLHLKEFMRLPVLQLTIILLTEIIKNP